MKVIAGSKEIATGGRRTGNSATPVEEEKLTDRKTLILSYYNPVKAYLSVFGINPAYLEDAVQDTMIEALSCMGKLKEVDKLKNWLLVIAKRVGLRYVTKANNTVECSLEECIEEGREVEFVSDCQLYNCIQRLDNEELARVINETLSEKEKKVLLLYYVYDHKLKDIAEIIGETDTNTRTLSARAKKKLKVKLEEGGYHEG